MSTLKTPFRYDFVGSFLRPEKLKAAKKAFEEGTITKEELDRITDECVTEIVAKQKAAGFHAITDGEFRRKFWHLDFMWGFEGVAHEKDGGGVQFNGEMADLEATYLVGKVKAKVHPFVCEVSQVASTSYGLWWESARSCATSDASWSVSYIRNVYRLISPFGRMR